MSSEFFEKFFRNEERNEALTENAADPAITDRPVGHAERMLQAIRGMLERRQNDE